MLVLSRKVGEAIAVGDQIMIKVLEVKGSQIKLGIEAPSGVRIFRDEIFVKVKEQNQLATSWDIGDFERVVSYMNEGEKERLH